jgi:hypothetical protein
MTTAELSNRGNRRGWQAMEMKRQEKRRSQSDDRGFSAGYDRLYRAILPVGAASPPYPRNYNTFFTAQ